MTIRKLTHARSWTRLGAVSALGVITCGLLGAGAATALADSNGQQINYHIPSATYPATVDPSMMGQMKQDYIQSASWVHKSEGWTLVVTPTAWARTQPTTHGSGEAGWAELYSKYKDKGRGIHANINGMRDQYICHQKFAFWKNTWDLDEWRPDVGLDRTQKAFCNPGKPGD